MTDEPIHCFALDAIEDEWGIVYVIVDEEDHVIAEAGTLQDALEKLLILLAYSA